MCNQFTEHHEVVNLIKDLKEEGIENKVFSNVVDENNKQYVDIVMEGGGVLGLALVGYTYVLEQMGIRFLGIGGTSAGAINALFQAACGIPHEAKTEKIISILAETNFYRFVDGDDDARDFIDAFVGGARTLKLFWKGWQVIDNINEDLGLNPGEEFLSWLTEELQKESINTSQDLQAKMNTFPHPLKLRGDGSELPLDDVKSKLVFISSDLTTDTKAQFPQMAGLYWENPESVNPAEFVRASMSIPFFFHPYIVKNIPQGTEAISQWRKHALYKGAIPKEVYFVDGGVMSNFPIDLFHRKNFGVPNRPTFGVKLGFERQNIRNIKGPISFLGAIFDNARHTLDNDFIKRNPDYKHLVSYINTDDYNWIDFKISNENKVGLFVEGAKTAADFLRKFDWQKYLQERQAIENAFCSRT
ncbi:patatin-like phospholipase family protein [Candidatus Uabimicrobium amorphum]|uniref:Esterase n=1 Tax=Uabimicrobium amorphum TaxID=2596890 RepID=A0A5S9IRX1_UABAM|nr:patatin-like phospholipase family protein [Candidatus Uabimicrobium amorphum]BBM86597.1 esterase [Candidatus Uabimicrobium amorphum]